MDAPSRAFWRTSCITSSSARPSTLQGIGKPSFTVQELLSDKFQFDKRECDLLRAHQAHLFSIGGEAEQEPIT